MKTRSRVQQMQFEWDGGQHRVAVLEPSPDEQATVYESGPSEAWMHELRNAESVENNEPLARTTLKINPRSPRTVAATGLSRSLGLLNTRGKASEYVTRRNGRTNQERETPTVGSFMIQVLARYGITEDEFLEAYARSLQ